MPLRGLGRSRLPRGRHEGRRVGRQDFGDADQHGRARGHDRLRAGHRPQEGFDEAIAATADQRIDSQTGDFTRDGGKNVMEAFLRSTGEASTCLSPTTTTWRLGAIDAIEAAGWSPGKDIKIVSIDAVHDGMQALADGKINYIVECNPLLGAQVAATSSRRSSPARTSTRSRYVRGRRRSTRSADRRPAGPQVLEAARGPGGRNAAGWRALCARPAHTVATQTSADPWPNRRDMPRPCVDHLPGRRDARTSPSRSPASRRSTASTSAPPRRESTP